MFERRLKILLALLAVVTLVLVLRAGQVQIVEHDEWTQAAADSMKRSQFIETVRGNILDRNGKVIALDQPCVDVCVDYRAIIDPPDPKWVLERADKRLRSRLGDDYAKASRSRRKELAETEGAAVRADIERMWKDLAIMSGQPPEQLSEIRSAIVSKVQMRQRLVKQQNYEKAMQKKEERQDQAAWRRWLVEGLASEKNDLEAYAVTVAEEFEAHVILRAATVEVQNYLGKYRDRFPGLELRASTHRYYPFQSAACHLMGRVSRVNREDLLSDKNPDDETRKYWPNDLIGRGGVESLLEPALRGTKGKIVKVPGQETELSRQDPVAGSNASVTIDIDLQEKLESAFTGAEVIDASTGATTRYLYHGAAVVIDVPTGEILALASYPTYDLNSFDELYKKLYDDEINSPLLNRATQAQLQPGSTCKPMVGLSAITSGLLTAESGIECTGYLVIDGKKRGVGRCWVAKMYANNPMVPTVAHHQIPFSAPHPTGFLTFSDALERSCNVFFETAADGLGLDGLSEWYERFGLGRPTGLGIAEARGRLPRSYDGPATDRRYKTWFSGIGQDPVAATPIQMANVAATIARGGIWMRPRLVASNECQRLGIEMPSLPSAPPAPGSEQTGPDGKALPVAQWPDVYDLHLDRHAVAAARDGMYRVVYGGAGTGKSIAQNAPALAGLKICGKTGTAQAGKFAVKLRDEKGALLKDEKGRQRYRIIEPSTPENPNPDAPPWYRGGGKDGRELTHAWYIGFAPADKPKVAFAVMVEYGGSGGGAAASVAKQALTSCVELGYVSGNSTPTETAQLLHDVAN